VRSAIAALAALVSAVPAGGGAGEPLASVSPTSFRATASHGNVVETYAWRQPDAFSQRRRRGGPFVGDVVERGGTRWYGASASGSGVVERRIFPARPDGYSYSELVLAPTEFVLARARAGRLRLRAARAGGRAAWRAPRVFLHANDCAGLRAGTLEVWLDRETLLPLRVVERRGRRAFRQTFRYERVGGSLPARDFARPRLGRRPRVESFGFVRTTPAAAAHRLSYAPLLPRTVPSGFRLAVSGWAPRSQRTGPEASNPRYRHLFAAVYRRGFERLDVTQRLAGRRGWIGDPFGRECEFQFGERVRVGGRAARYGIGPNIPPHVYWRDGRLLLTVSGALAKRELLAVAASLAPVSP
jgi:hypothetical protein